MPKKKQPDPSPVEIREACLEIQSEWTEAERQRRAGVFAVATPYPHNAVRGELIASVIDLKKVKSLEKF